MAKEVEDDDAEAQEKADAPRERAQADIDAAREQMVAARQLADDAASEARAAADEARRSADQLASQAEAQASDADARVAEADGVRRQVSHEAANVVREVERNDATNDLNEQTKGELVELASSLGIEGRTQMNKDELVKAIRSASKKSAQSRS
ncbi:MAG: Rho termination factor N-terminal domain-containing protein [Ilumatobacteraceae bacterium]